ncbi:hypothetical protein MUCCIDRAFT_136814 [Mucor lusitanicus CBS 277.49]|uniref:UDENN domain-containing protein n=1 Tax=Mucor lusitanicus CBS 277.49 TaxID=747725 RepID=A0A162ZX81_MUCCL|nr:hypothetical protein MUCCIDRAFT_136814 [Mucor lusitanicus CBS 277.49]
MSDSVFDYPLRKQCSTSVLQSSTHSLGASASHPNLIVKDDLHILHRTPTPPFSPSPPPPSSTTAGQDITDNGSEDKFLTLDPLDLANFRKWIVGFCIVNFDLEIGQALDYAYPPMDLTITEQKNICFTAFPDSNVFEVGDQIFNIRVRASTSKFAASGPTAEAGFLYGYVFFRQKKDPTIRRGYFQAIVSILGPAYFDTGQPMLEAACMNIAQWYTPRDGKVIDLPFLGRLLQVELPTPFKPQLLETTPFDMNKLKPDVQIMASLPVGGLYHHFRDILKDLWLLWELMLLAEPIVVIAPDPGVCSEAVVSLVDIINPIPYCGDYRPYFTIQDSDFKSFVTKNKPLSSLVLGVTNPFFNTAVQHWPNIVRVGRQQLSICILENPNLDLVINQMFLTSKRKSVISRDRELVKMLTEASVRGYPPDWVLNNILRRHFVDLTEKFLVPLNRYFSTLIPVNISAAGEAPRLRPFQTDQFMKSLKEHGPQLPFKSTFKTRTSTTDPTKELYSQFLKCGNFATWLQQRTTRAEVEMNKKRTS